MYDLLLKLICDNAYEEMDVSDITSDTNLIEDLDYDSIALMQLLADIEDEFEINLSNDDLLADKLDTPASLWELISRHKNSGQKEEKI